MLFVWIYEILVTFLPVLLYCASACQEQLIESDHGVIRSPKYPKRYPNNLECTWRITVEETFIIRLEFTAFELDHNKKGFCKDTLQIYDGEEQDNRELFKSCDESIEELEDKVIFSSENTLLLKLTTSKKRRKKGFLANFTALPGSATTSISTETTGTLIPTEIRKAPISAETTTPDGATTKSANVILETAIQDTTIGGVSKEETKRKGRESTMGKVANNSWVSTKVTSQTATKNKLNTDNKLVDLTTESVFTTNDLPNTAPPVKLRPPSNTNILAKCTMIATSQTDEIATTQSIKKEELTRKMITKETSTLFIPKQATSTEETRGQGMTISTHETATQETTIKEISTIETRRHETPTYETEIQKIKTQHISTLDATRKETSAHETSRREITGHESPTYDISTQDRIMQEITAREGSRHETPTNQRAIEGIMTQELSTLDTTRHQKSTQETSTQETLLPEISTKYQIKIEKSSQGMNAQETRVNQLGITEEGTTDRTTNTLKASQPAGAILATTVTSANESTNEIKSRYDPSTKLEPITQEATPTTLIKTNPAIKKQTTQKGKIHGNSTQRAISQEITTPEMTAQDTIAHLLTTQQKRTTKSLAKTEEPSNGVVNENLTAEEITATQTTTAKKATTPKQTTGTKTTKTPVQAQSVRGESSTTTARVFKSSTAAQETTTLQTKTTGESTKLMVATTNGTPKEASEIQEITTKKMKTSKSPLDMEEEGTTTRIAPTSKKATTSRESTTSKRIKTSIRATVKATKTKSLTTKPSTTKPSTTERSTTKQSRTALTETIAPTTTAAISTPATNTTSTTTTQFKMLPITRHSSDSMNTYIFTPGEFSSTQTSSTLRFTLSPSLGGDDFIALYGVVPPLLLLTGLLAFIIFAFSKKRKEKKFPPSSTADNCHDCETSNQHTSVIVQPELFHRVGYQPDKHLYEFSLAEMINVNSKEDRTDEDCTPTADEGYTMNIIYESYDGVQNAAVNVKDNEHFDGEANTDITYETVNESFLMPELYDEIHWESEEGFEIYVIYEPCDEVVPDTAINSTNCA